MSDDLLDTSKFGAMKLSAVLMFVGIVFIGYAYSLAPYKDEALFIELYMALSEGQSAEYWKLRDEMLTPKFRLQDYGGTTIAIAAGVFIVSRKGWRQLKSPPSRARLFGVAFFAPFLTVGAYIFDLFQGYARVEFPHWADSMSVPLVGVPVLLVVLLLWAGAQLALLGSSYQSAPLALAVSRRSSWWLLSISAITIVLVALCVSVGQYWYAIPGTVWLYYYISLAAARRAVNAAEPVAPLGRCANKPGSRP
ncbi:MAG: hypothetical protein WCK08_02580 [Betaproteobacteria bacterium]